MYISHKLNVIQQVHETEWQCRRISKEQTKPEYHAWLATITTQDEKGLDVITYPSENFTIVECTDENVKERFIQLDDYVSSTLEGMIYNIKWSDDKVGGSHLVGDDDAKDARLLAEEWTRIRNERTRLLAETDWMAGTDTTLNVVWKAYRKELRDLPDDQSSKTSFDDIVWPTKPS